MSSIEIFLKLIEDGYLRIDTEGNVYSGRTGKKLSMKGNRLAFRVSNDFVVRVNASEFIYCYFNNIKEIPDGFYIRHLDDDIENCKINNLYLFTCYENKGKKHCQKCKTVKNISDFYKNARNKDGYNSECKECHASWIDDDKTSEYHKKHYSRNRERLLEYQRKYKESNRELINKRKGDYFKRNPITRLARNLRTRVIAGIHGYAKSKRTEDLLGCSFEEFYEYLESKFQNGMTWENYGIKGWHIDHIIPCAAFDLSKPEEQEKCFHYTNLQPLWAGENLSKNSFYNGKRYSFDRMLEK